MRYSILSTVIGIVHGHGKVTSPATREPGPAMLAACGQQVYNNQASNDQGSVQNELQVASSQSDYNPAECNLYLCKGYMFADNQANVQSFTPGQTVNILAEISAPHTGTCNVSIVSTKTNGLISDSLIYFSDYASNSHTIPANNTNFNITMPKDLDSQCAVAGDCVVHWFWNAADIDQTYESCIDFTMYGSGNA